MTHNSTSRGEAIGGNLIAINDAVGSQYRNEADDDLFAVSLDGIGTSSQAPSPLNENNTMFDNDEKRRGTKPEKNTSEMAYGDGCGAGVQGAYGSKRKEGHEAGCEVEPGDESDMESDLDELTPLEYARMNCLARDHLAEGYIRIEEIQKEFVDHSTGDSHLPQFKLGGEFKVEERLSMSKDGATLLASIVQAETGDAIKLLIKPMLEFKKKSSMSKLELPLLRTNHQTDCKQFAQREGLNIKLQDVKLPLEVVDDANGLGLGWPAQFWEIGPQLLEKLRGVKINASKDGINFLQDALKVDWTHEDHHALWNIEMKYKKNKALEPVTPPLSPVDIAPAPFEPVSTDSAFDIPILSNPGSFIKKQFEEIEQKILNQDIPTPLRHFAKIGRQASPSSGLHSEDDMVQLRDVYSPLASLANSDPPLEDENVRFRRQDLKTEEILTPQGPTLSLPKTVRFSEVIEELMLDLGQSHLNTPEFESKFFEEAFASAAETAIQKLEQEKLIEADAIARVGVPLMDFSKPTPPWKRLETQKGKSSLLDLQKMFIQDVVGQCREKWPGARKCDMKLRWIPFDKNLATVAKEEKLDIEEGILAAFLTSLSDQEVIGSSGLTWKPPGLMIVRDEDEDEDEIATARFQPEESLNLTSLVKKRKLEIQQRAALEDNFRSSKHSLNGGTISRGKYLESKHPSASGNAASLKKAIQRQSTEITEFSVVEDTNCDYGGTKFGGLLEETFSAENSLENYLEVRGTKKPKLMDSCYFGAKVTKPSTSNVPSRMSDQVTIQLHSRKSPLTMTDPLPTPNIQLPATKFGVIVASGLLKHRALMKQIGIHLPSLEFVERDFSAHNSTMWIPGSVTRSPIVSPLASEADLLVSGSTGFIITTLQKIKQKLLPGQKGRTEIRDRIEKVSLRYEKLFVFVSEGRRDETTNGLGESDCLALSELTGFSLGLNSFITIQFVAGGEKTLAQWIANAVVQNKVAVPLELLAEETHWELFLRRAGMNAFAAQIIISELKASDSVCPTISTVTGQSGLAAFVRMERMERISRFKNFCGWNLLERVSAVIDRDWKI